MGPIKKFKRQGVQALTRSEPHDLGITVETGRITAEPVTSNYLAPGTVPLLYMLVAW